MGRSLRGLVSNTPHRLSSYLPIFLFTLCISHLSTQVLRHLCFAPALSSMESKHGGQLQNLAMLAINHPLDCQTQRDMGRIGNTLHCILFSSSSYAFFNHLFLSMTKFKEQTLNHISSFLKIPLFYWWQVWFLHSPLLLFYIFKVQKKSPGVFTYYTFSNIPDDFVWVRLTGVCLLFFPTTVASVSNRTLCTPLCCAFSMVQTFSQGWCFCCYFSLITIVQQEQDSPRPSGTKAFDGQKRKRKWQQWVRKTLNR